jgi:4-carboxymuconolactone decarboxylase
MSDPRPSRLFSPQARPRNAPRHTEDRAPLKIENEPRSTAAPASFHDNQGGLHMDERERYDAGVSVRRAVFGDAHVDRSLANRNRFNEEFQDLVTRYSWGEIWTRSGLPRQTRSLLTLALMIALNRGDEFRLHVRAAVNNGVSRDEIKEVLLQCAIYCGVAAAGTAFQIAQEVFAEMDAVR